MKDIKIFHSGYTEQTDWVDIVYHLENRGHIVYGTIQPHDIAVILGGYWENPTVFKNPIVFYKQTKPYIHEFLTDILKEYYDNMIDLTGKTREESIECIIRKVDEKSL